MNKKFEQYIAENIPVEQLSQFTDDSLVVRIAKKIGIHDAMVEHGNGSCLAHYEQDILVFSHFTGFENPADNGFALLVVHDCTPEQRFGLSAMFLATGSGKIGFGI